MRKLWVFLFAIAMTAGMLAPAGAAGSVSPGVTSFDPNAIVVLAYLDHRQGLMATAKSPRVALAIGDGTLLLTAAHCVTDLQPSSRQAISTDIVVISPYYGDIFNFRIVALDQQADLAILKPAWPSHPALTLATEEEFVAAKQILVASRPQVKEVQGDLRTELLPILRVDETTPNIAIALKGTQQVAPGWSGSPMLIPGNGRVAGVLTQRRAEISRFSLFFHRTRFDALGSSIRSIRSLLQRHGLEAAALARPGKLEPIPDAPQGFSAAIGHFQSLFSHDDAKLRETAGELARLRPGSVQAHLLLATALASPKDESTLPTEERFSQAESNYKRALEIDPNGAYAHAAYGSFLVTRGRRAEALAQSEAALRIDPNDRLAQINRLMLLPAAQCKVASERLIATEPNDPYGWFYCSSALLNLGKKDEALQAAQKAVALDPNGLFYGTLADVLVSLARVDEAEPYYKRMTERCGCQLCWYKYAAFLLQHRTGRLDEASQAFETAESKAWMGKVSEKDVTTLKILLLEKTSPQEAESLARTRLDADPNDAATWWHLAGILRTRNKYADAVVAARKAVDLKPDERYQPRLANCLAKAGELDAAQRVYDEMLQRHAERSRYWYWYAEFLVDYHPTRLDEARQAVEKARSASDPNWLAPAGDLKKLLERSDMVVPNSPPHSHGVGGTQ